VLMNLKEIKTHIIGDEIERFVTALTAMTRIDDEEDDVEGGDEEEEDPHNYHYRSIKKHLQNLFQM
ncbi:hypothetical protein HK101_005712, partial [Irineochytrium annulatum]